MLTRLRSLLHRFTLRYIRFGNSLVYLRVDGIVYKRTTSLLLQTTGGVALTDTCTISATVDRKTSKKRRSFPTVLHTL